MTKTDVKPTEPQRQIVVGANEKVCLNCAHYDPWLCRGYGNIVFYYITSRGRCVKHSKVKSALQRPCKDFEWEEQARGCQRQLTPSQKGAGQCRELH